MEVLTLAKLVNGYWAHCEKDESWHGSFEKFIRPRHIKIHPATFFNLLSASPYLKMDDTGGAVFLFGTPVHFDTSMDANAVEFVK